MHACTYICVWMPGLHCFRLWHSLFRWIKKVKRELFVLPAACELRRVVADTSIRLTEDAGSTPARVYHFYLSGRWCFPSFSPTTYDYHLFTIVTLFLLSLLVFAPFRNPTVRHQHFSSSQGRFTILSVILERSLYEFLVSQFSLLFQFRTEGRISVGRIFKVPLFLFYFSYFRRCLSLFFHFFLSEQHIWKICIKIPYGSVVFLHTHMSVYVYVQTGTPKVRELKGEEEKGKNLSPKIDKTFFSFFCAIRLRISLRQYCWALGTNYSPIPLYEFMFFKHFLISFPAIVVFFLYNLRLSIKFGLFSLHSDNRRLPSTGRTYRPPHDAPHTLREGRKVLF